MIALGRRSLVVAVASATLIGAGCAGPVPSPTTGSTSTATAPPSVPVSASPSAAVSAAVTPTATAAGERLPAFPPDAPLFAYNRLTDGGGGLFVSNPDGTGLTQLAIDVLPGVHKRISWSPDGQRIAFIDEVTGRLWIAHLDGSPTERVAACDRPGCDYPAFSPDGQRIAFSRAGEPVGPSFAGPGKVGIEIVDLASGDVTEVIVLARPELGDVPAWSPDGDWISFQRETMDDDGPDTGSSLAIVRVTGGEPTLLTSPASFASFPDWSWVRDEITFSSQLNDLVRSPSPDLSSDIWVIKPDGSGLRQVTDMAPGARMLGPRWTPDGTGITAFDTSRGAVRIDPATGEMENLPTPEDFSRPVLRPRSTP